MEYHEDVILTRYVWDHYQHLMTDFERSVGMACLIRMKTDAYRNPDPLADAIEWLQRNQLDSDAARAAIENPHQFRDDVRDRVLDECKVELFVNRCSECGKVVSTPKARQCLRCGHDWH